MRVSLYLGKINLIIYLSSFKSKSFAKFSLFYSYQIKPNSKRENCGYLQVGAELYGGGNWLSWFDRDLKIAGRVMVKVCTCTTRPMQKDMVSHQ